MRTKLVLALILLASMNGFSQTKAETLKTINELLLGVVGNSDTILVNGKEKEFKIIANSFSVDENGKTGEFITKFKNKDESFENKNTSIIRDWKGFKIHTTVKNTKLTTIYPIFQKRDGERHNDKNGIKYYCLTGNEDKLITSLNHLQGLYSKK